MNTKNSYISFLTLIFACFLSGCSEQEPKPDKEQLQVQLGIDKLKQACSQSLKIVDIIPTFYSDRSQYNAGWFFSFSDGTEIEVLDQTVIKSAVSQRLPFIKTDLEGDWIFSYPEGESDYILDKEGKKINVFNNSGTVLNLNDDLQIRLVADNSGTYFLELSGSSGPTSSSQYIETPYISDDSGEILMVIRDDFSGRASIFLSDGERYDFNILKNIPETITPLVSDKIAFKKKGEEIKFDIIINPSNIFINHEISSEECQISLRIPYINEDENAVLPFELANVVVSHGPDNKIIPGRYTITLKDSGNSRFVYEEEVSLNLWFYDENGERIFISSQPFTVGFAGYDYPAQNEEFPILFINTPEPIISKYDWVKDCEIEIYSSPTNSIQIKDVNMKGRGNSTWVVPKNLWL